MTSAKRLYVGSRLDTRALETPEVGSAWVKVVVGVAFGVPGFAMPLDKGAAWHKKVKVGTEGKNNVGMD